ncbi:MAG TPA: amidohydrolase family protein [Gemmatimonadales bacterium]|nr:amidohydrolase family protein [Gemmatimonadales bacterium]
MRSSLYLIATVAVLTRPAAAQEPAVAITNVTVIPMDTERSMANQTVIVKGQRIAEMGPASSIKTPAGARVIDGRGKFLLPGMAEMHGHIPPGGGATDANISKVLAYYALNGVTFVRGMLGDPKHLPWRERANKGEVLSPTIITTGPSLNGQTIPTVEVAIKTVTDQKNAGYDLMKIHPGIKRNVYDSMAATARRLGIRFAGHVPLDVGINDALAQGQWTIDHVDGYIEGLAPAGSESQFFGFNLVAQADRSKLPALVAATKKAGAWIVPTQSLFESMLGTRTADELAAMPEMKYWPAATVAQWKKITIDTRQGLGVTAETSQKYNELRRDIMQALYKGGVPFLLGSDAPQFWNVPGFSLLREMEAMAKAGFTPYQILESGSRNAARYLNQEKEFGTVAAGKRADLVLLNANPLTNVSNWGNKAGVMIRGKYYSADEIQAKLQELNQQ